MNRQIRGIVALGLMLSSIVLARTSTPCSASEHEKDVERQRRIARLDSQFDSVVFEDCVAKSEVAYQQYLKQILQGYMEWLGNTCSLTPAQKRKLEFAGRGDIARVLDRVHESRMRVHQIFEMGQLLDLEQMKRQTAEIRSTIATGPFGKGSLFLRFRDTELSANQLARLRGLIIQATVLEVNPDSSRRVGMLLDKLFARETSTVNSEGSKAPPNRQPQLIAAVSEKSLSDEFLKEIEQPGAAVILSRPQLRPLHQAQTTCTLGTCTPGIENPKLGPKGITWGVLPSIDSVEKCTLKIAVEFSTPSPNERQIQVPLSGLSVQKCEVTACFGQRIILRGMRMPAIQPRDRQRPKEGGSTQSRATGVDPTLRELVIILVPRLAEE